ncbi:MAG: alkaline phosphatase PhoX [Actinomycetota bacterium]
MTPPLPPAAAPSPDTRAADLGRRRLLQLLVGGGIGAVVAGFAITRLLDDGDPLGAIDGLTTDPSRGGYGRLTPAGDRLALPPGFTYRELSVDGQMMADGRPTPPAPDGMTALAGADGTVRLLRNHELERWADSPTESAYDAVAGGGVTRVVVNPDTRELLEDHVALAGTVRNCSGGPTPWGSWLSCEETLLGLPGGYDRPHGYVFDVAADGEGPVDPIPLTALGRFAHEAVAVDLQRGVVYETEDDRPDAGFYRFVADAPAGPDGRLDLGQGRLQALAVDGDPATSLHNVVRAATAFPAVWVDVDDPDPDVEGGTTVFGQAVASGAARFRRLEGCAIEDGVVWFTSTDGGQGNGQIWRYAPDDDERGTLTMVYAAPNANVLDGPDNIVVSPQGALVICEDNGRDFNRLVALGPDGLLVPLAINIGDSQELAGATFSPDGRTLFLNAQGGEGIQGRTFAIWGPWETGIV